MTNRYNLQQWRSSICTLVCLCAIETIAENGFKWKPVLSFSAWKGSQTLTSEMDNSTGKWFPVSCGVNLWRICLMRHWLFVFSLFAGDLKAESSSGMWLAAALCVCIQSPSRLLKVSSDSLLLAQQLAQEIMKYQVYGEGERRRFRQEKTPRAADVASAY